MLRWLVPVALVMPQAGPPSRAEDPREIVWIATRAVEGDSAARAGSRWSRRIARDSTDRAARLGLATLARLRYDYPAAERAYRGLIAGRRDRFAMYAHLGLAEGFEARSMTRDARVALDRGRGLAAELGDPLAAGQALLQLSFNRGRLEGVAIAQALLDTAATLIPDSLPGLQARLRQRNAITDAITGKPAEATTEALAGIQLARRASERRVEADGFRVLGQVLQYRGQWDSALAALRQSESLYVATRSRSSLASSLVWHAQVLGSQARYGEMRGVAERALKEGEATGNSGAIGDAHRMFGVLASMLGDWPGARSHFERSLATSIATGDSSTAMTTSRYLARVALAAGDIATAKRIILENRDWAARTGATSTLYESERALAGIADREGDRAEASRALAAARNQLRLLQGPNYRIWMEHADARHAVAIGDWPLARQRLESFLEQEKGLIGNVARFDARVRLADVHVRLGDVKAAERELVLATEELDAWRSRLGEAEMRNLAFQAVATVDASAAEPDAIEGGAGRVLAAMARAGRADAAFDIAERWRARALMDRLTRAEGLRATPGGAGFRGALTSVPPRTAREIMASVPDQAAILEYVAAPDAPVTVFIVQRSRIEAIVLAPGDAITPAITRSRALLESGGEPGALSRALGAALIDPVVARLPAGVTRLVVIPDGPLHRLAFDALRLADGRLVVERFALSHAPSATVFATLRSRVPTTRAPPPLLALGDPKQGSASGLPRLTGASREAKLVARYTTASTVRLGADASASFLRRSDLRPYRVLHFATHAVVDERSVSGTALVLSPAREESGLIGPGDLGAMRINADLVVLSACASAGGALASGEGVQGLTSAFLQAGARSLVATGWRIGDRSVVPLVEGFYSGLARGETIVDALRSAKLAAIRAGAAPRTWAAFMAIGDPFVGVPLSAPAKRWWTDLFEGTR